MLFMRWLVILSLALTYTVLMSFSVTTEPVIFRGDFEASLFVLGVLLLDLLLLRSLRFCFVRSSKSMSLLEKLLFREIREEQSSNDTFAKTGTLSFPPTLD